MANPILCVSCASLPVKDCRSAAKRQRCAECKADIGMTAYGVCFRVLPVKRRFLPSPKFLARVTIGAGLFMVIVTIVGMGLWLGERSARTPARSVDSAAPDELARIPEVALDDAFPSNIGPGDGKMRLNHLIARIRRENAVKVDGFMIAQIDRRKELQGLPFVMGDACRIGTDRARLFQTSVQAVRDSMVQDMRRSRVNSQADEHHSTFWNTYLANSNNQGVSTDSGLAALTQILGPERMPLRAGYMQRLSTVHRPDATKMLAKAAIFDPAGEVRSVAIQALKDRPKEEYTDVLMQGLRYPMALVAQRTAVALVLLDRQDLLPQLVNFLAEPAPSDPVTARVDQKQVCVVREVVRINHHRNCLLCHAPSTTGSTEEVPGVLPIPGSPFPESPSEAYGSAQSSGDPMVRADTTYLRQDFSVMMPVQNAAPWPDRQRFDFLVRTRVVGGTELLALQQKIRERTADYLSENHKAAIRALRELTGQQDVAPNQAAWQRVVGHKK